MNARNQSRVNRQARKERPFKDRQRDTSTESTRSTNPRNDTRIDLTKNRKQRENKADEQANRSRDKNYETAGRIPPADPKDRGKNEPLRRPEKGSGFREKNNALVQRDGYRDSLKDRRVGNFSDDSPLSQLVRQINKETDSDKRLAASKKLEEFVNQPSNFQAVIKVVDEILSFAEAIFRERSQNSFELKDQIAKCVGIITGHLGSEAKGFIFLVISKVETSTAEEHKSLLIKILTKAVEQDEKKHRFRDFIPMLLKKLHVILENADTSDLLHSVLSIIMPIAVEYPQVFSPHFRDIIDILIGWHIDTKQHGQLIQFTSDCLISLHRYWVSDINFSLTLLTQFLEDMEAYSEELQCIASGQLTESDVSPPYSSLPRLTALVRVFTTVMNGIGECFTPLRSPTITQEYVTKLSKGVIDCVRSGGYSFFYEDLFKAANECFGIMCCFLKSQFSSCCEMATEFALEQLERKSLTFAHTKSVLAFIKQVIKHVNSAIPGSFVLLLLNSDSAIMKLRFCADEEVLKRLVEICQCLLNIKSIPLIEETYRIFVKDIRVSYSQLKENIDEQDSDSSLTFENVEGKSSPVTILKPEKQDYSCENMSLGVKLYKAQVKTVFDLQVLGSLTITQPPVNSLVLKPSVIELLINELSPTDWEIACRFPAVQYTIVCSLYDHCKRNKYFFEDSSMNTGSNKVEFIDKVQNIILEILQCTLSSCDIRKLCIAWIVDLVELVNISETELLPNIDFDSMVEALLPLTYLPDEDVRLTVSGCIKLMIQRKLLSNDTIKRTFEECVFHVTDVCENVKNTFVQLLATVPVDLTISFGLDKSNHGLMNGKRMCDVPLTLSITGSWLARKIHMMKPSTGTFHSHNFRVVSSFILHGVFPAKDENQDWLLHLYHTCQRSSQEKLQNHPMNDKYYFSRRHDPNSVVPISSNYALLWFWATWEMAQFCVLARLKTPLGRAQETFQAIESVLRECLNQVYPDMDKKPIRIKKKVAPQEPPKTNTESTSQPPVVCQLQVKLLLQFVENLDKLMYSAYEGAAVSLPPFPKAVRLFFRTNKSTCQEWLSRIRGIITSVSIECGEPATAVRQGLHRLKELKNAGKGKERDFELTTLAVAKALCQLKASEAMQGLSTWCRKHCERVFPWLEAMIHKSNGRYERAICEYEKCLQVFQTTESNEGTTSDLSSTLNSSVLNFLVNEVTDCYTKLTDWSEVEQWQKTVQEMRSHLPNPEFQQAANVKVDMNYIRALRDFENVEFVGVRDCLELIPGASLNFIIDRIGGSPLSLEKEETKTGGYTFTPSWSPQQMLQASDINMMQALTLYWTSGMAGGGTKKDEALRNELHDLLGHGNDLLEGVITNGAKSWPPSIPEIHAVQYYGMNLLSKILSGKHEEDASHFMPFSSNVEAKSSPRSSLDSAVMCKVLQITAYNYNHHKLHCKYEDQTRNQLSAIQLATIHTARKEQNFRVAYKLLRLLPYIHKDQISSLSKEDKTSIVNLPRGESSVYMETLSESLCEDLKELESLDIQSVTKSCIYNESAKLLYALGFATKAAGVLCDSILVNKGKLADQETKKLNAKTLCTLAKWMISDKKMLSGNAQLKSNLLQVVNLEEGQQDSKTCFDDVDILCGRLLTLSSQYAPELDKSWFMLAGWAYKAGRKVVEQACSGGSVEISTEERETIMKTLAQEVGDEETEEILSILSKGHFTTLGIQDEEINSGNEVLTREEETVKKQLVAVSEVLSESCVESLVSIWRGICERLFSHYRTAVNAYFKYLRLHGKASVKCDVDSDRHVTATLRLLRLLVKHAGELKTELEQGFLGTPTAPWEGIIPQLFSRLNHPEEYVRKGVTDLLCRVSKDSSHLILYPAIVGCSGNNLRRDRNTSSLMTLVASRSHDQDSSFTLNDDEENFDLNQDQTLQSGYHAIVESLADGNSRLVSEVQDFVQELRRVTLLWEELWLGSLIQIHHDFEKRENQLNDEIKRVNSSTSLSVQEKSALIKGKHIALMKPIVFALEQLQSITNKQHETPHEAWFQKTYSPLIENALHALRNPEDPSKPQTSWAKFRQLLQSLQQRSQKRSSVNLRLEEISPKLCKLKPSFIYMPGQEFSMSKVVTVNSLENDVVILPTKTRPKKIVLVGSDGQKYMYLFKGLEDLHLDERIMQFLSICNNMFAKTNRYEDNVFLARHYSVTPLGPRSGLIQWVDGAVPIFSLYKRWQQRDAAATVALTKNEHGSGLTTTPKVSLRPNELFYNRLTPLLKERSIDVSSSNRKDWPISIMRKVLEELLHETPQDLLEKELWCSSTCTSDWWKMSQTYSRSVAVMSIIGYILGLGDRHLDNMLIDFTTGEIVHIDYNICFEKGRGLRVPEKVPFRLTANLEAALGVTGVEGTFRGSCEKVLRILRNGRETLLTLLEAFVYDPLVDWTTGSDNAFANAFYGGQALDQQDVKQSKKDMERTITQCLFSSRVAEMRVSWRGNKDEMISSLNNLKEAVGSHFSTIGQSLIVLENDKKLLGQMEILQSAVKSTTHPLHAVQTKYDEQAKMVNDLESVLQTIQARLKECQQWDVQHQAALDTVRGTKLASIDSELNKSPNVRLPSFTSAFEFLKNAGQSSTVDQCKSVETELIRRLGERRSHLKSCLGVLHTYATVISQFPANYSHNSRSSDWQSWLKKLIESSSTEECKAIMTEYETKHKAPVTVDDEAVSLINVETKLQNIFNEQKTKFAKFFERRNQEKVETAFLNNEATEAFQKLTQFVHDNGNTGKLATMHVVVTGLSSLHNKCLVMENTAKVAESRLLDVVSRDGDWFLEELVSMAGNVMQFATFARNYWMNFLDTSEPCVQSVMKSVQAFTSVYQMYKSLQDMMTNFRNIIVPETLKCLEIGDPTVLEILANFQDILSSCDLSLDEMIQIAQTAVLKKENDVSTILKISTAAVELENKFMELLCNENNETSNENGEDEHKIMMSAGQMLLAGFNGLFTKLESEVDTLLAAVDHVNPSFEDGVDVYKEIQELMIKRSENRDLMKTLYFLKRLNAMKMFFADSLRHIKSLSNNSPESQPDYILSEDQLSVYVRRFIADFVQERILGLPSFVLTKIIVQWLSMIGLDLTKNLKENGQSLEDLCKKTVDQSIRQELFTANVLSQANSLTGAFNTAWRKHDFARRLDLNVSLYRCVVQRAQLTLARFQWFHEDILSAAAVRGNAMITPTRATVMNDLRKRVQSLVSYDVCMSSVQDKLSQLESSIEQRLKWAAGANPSLNPTLERFESTLKERKRLIMVESKYSSDICGISNAILHFEAFRTRTSEALAADQTLASLVQRCEECSAKVEKSQDSLKDVEDLMAKINVSSPPAEPITLDWMKTRLGNIKDDLLTNQTQKQQVDKRILESKEYLRSQVGVVKGAWSAHQVLMSEVKSMLQALAKDEEAAESTGARTFIMSHNKLNEVATKMLKDILNMCSSNAGKSSVDQEDSVKSEIFDSINSVQAIAIWVFDQLPTLASPLVTDVGVDLAEKPSESPTLTFASALRQGGQQGSSVAKETMTSVALGPGTSAPSLTPAVKEVLSPVQVFSPAKQTTPGSVAPTSLAKKSATMRDPRTGKAVQERNMYAIGVWKRVKAKLDGRDIDPTKRMSVEDQVDHIIDEATSKDNLCLMYEGWTPWV